jgi:hypothetical protein
MDEQLHTLDTNDLGSFDAAQNQLALSALESGKVIYMPSYFFQSPFLNKEEILSESLLDGKHKNVSFDYRTGRVGGFKKEQDKPERAATLKLFMQDYANFAKQMVDTLFPQYSNNLQWGRTSYRPAQIKGRASSKRKDDTRLHVDSFAASPVNGLRILRVFCNINPFGEPRVWHLGEPFSEVLPQFAPKIPAYSVKKAKLLQLIKVTKTLRTAYDHYQLHLHDMMKCNDDYQENVIKTRVDFRAQSSWMVFTDHVSHAALSGQFLLEQTFYLPVSAMTTPDISPLKYWEREKAVSMVHF